MRFFFALTCVGYLAAVTYAFITFPDRVPIHFDSMGTPDRHRPKDLVLIGVLGVGLVLMLLFEILIRSLPSKGLESLNVPHRDHWLRPENRAELSAKVTADLSFLGGCTILLLSGAIVLTSVALEDPTAADLGRGGLALLMLFVVVTLGYVVFMYSARYKPRSAPR